MSSTNQAGDDLLQLSFLGEFRIEWGETAVTITSLRQQLLLAYLILNRDKTHTRQQLSFLLWPDSTEAQARTNLRQMIFHLRQDIPRFAEIFQVERRTICWLPDAPMRADLIAFETAYLRIRLFPVGGVEAVSQAQQSNDTDLQKQHLTQAIACYQGDFLPDHYDNWVLVAREYLRQQYHHALETLLQQLETEQEIPTAITYAQQLLAADPVICKNSDHEFIS